MKILLLQARNADDPILQHEHYCFAKGCHLDPDCFRRVNLAVDAFGVDDVAGVDAVMVGGSGDYSLATGGFDWHDDFLELMRGVIRSGVPTFASCFGFQAIVQALGGTIVKDERAGEVGTFEISLTAQGQADPFFAGVEDVFDAQLGHNDSALHPLPEGLLNLASSKRCAVQAVRVRDTRVIATQFHPELAMEDNIVRYIRYLHAYDPELDDDEARHRAERIHRPSPVANGLLRRFLDTL